ncbi:hypothetical protein ACFL02_08240 [Planctomycetota bacterium]
MSNFASKIWDYLFKRSHQQSTLPKVQPLPFDDALSGAGVGNAGPIETYIDIYSIVGSDIKLGKTESAFIDSLGQLVRTHNTISIPLGCGHLISEIQPVQEEHKTIKGLAGQCCYCSLEYQALLEKGEISVFDAQRLSMVCTVCAKMTSSGRLCCPRHYTEVSNPDGSKSVLDPKQAEAESRKQIVKTILYSLALPFLEEDQPSTKNHQTEDDENNHA